MKNILILCTGNSCRSIIAEAIINKKLSPRIKAYSSGVNPSGQVHPNAKKVLLQHDIWRDEYHSKTLDKVLHINFDLVITVCDNAKESCPLFPQKTKVIHIAFEDPNGKGFEEFEKTYNLIYKKLLPYVTKL